MRSRSRSAGAAIGALVIAMSAGACASLPTSGKIQTGSLHGSGGSAQLGVQVVPLSPGPNWVPTQIVRGFLTASASFADHDAVARKYLTKSYAARWKPGWAATVISAPQVAKAATLKKITTGGPPDVQVNVTTRSLATMTTTGTYAAGSVVVSPGSHEFAFALTQVGGHWRIEAIYANNKQIPRNTLLLLQPDFERVYQARNLYYFPADSTAQALIPEPVYMPAQAPAALSVAGLVKRLLTKPPNSSWLYGAARTAFPHGTSVQHVQVVGGVAVVDLSGSAASASSARRARMAAQLYWTLTASPYSGPAGTPIRSVVFQLNHKTWKQMSPPFDSGGVPRGQVANIAQLFFQAPSATGAPSVMATRSKGPAAFTLPAGLGSGSFTAIAVTPGLHQEAVFAGCRGKDVYIVPQWGGTKPVTVHLPAPCTSLSWDVQRNLWVAAGDLAYLLPDAGNGSPTAPKIVPVVCSTLQSATKPPQITSLRVAPDGVRVAMIVTYHSGMSDVLMGAISMNDGVPYLGQSGALVRVGSDIADPTALTWLDPDHLLVVGKTDGSSQVYEVPLNGGSSTQVAAPAPPGLVSIAASWPHSDDLPRVVGAVAASSSQPGSVWMSKAGLLNRGWSLVAKGTTPVFPG